MRAVGACLITCFIGTVLTSATQYQGWVIPEGGRDEKRPVSVVADATRGKALYATHCANCHGPQGKGDGPGSDYAADLTDDLRTELNTEGVLFYKIWNGRMTYGKGPTVTMPAFNSKLEKDQVWLLVEYLKVLRTPRK